MKGEGFEPRETHAQPLHLEVGGQEDRTTVDPTGEGDPDGFLRIKGAELFTNFVSQCSDILATDGVEVSRQ